jgi:hypothetical protein
MTTRFRNDRHGTQVAGLIAASANKHRHRGRGAGSQAADVQGLLAGCRRAPGAATPTLAQALADALAARQIVTGLIRLAIRCQAMVARASMPGSLSSARRPKSAPASRPVAGRLVIAGRDNIAGAQRHPAHGA